MTIVDVYIQSLKVPLVPLKVPRKHMSCVVFKEWEQMLILQSIIVDISIHINELYILVYSTSFREYCFVKHFDTKHQKWNQLLVQKIYTVYMTKLTVYCTLMDAFLICLSSTFFNEIESKAWQLKKTTESLQF